MSEGYRGDEVGVSLASSETGDLQIYVFFAPIFGTARKA